MTRAEEILARGIPGVATERSLSGIAIDLPLEWRDGRAVRLYLSRFASGYRLVDDGTAIPPLDETGRLAADAPERAFLAGEGLGFDDHASEVFADLDALEDLPRRAMAMGGALVRLAAMIPDEGGDDAAGQG